MTQESINPFSRLLLRQKFAILAVLAFVLVGTAFYSVIDHQWEKINVTQREQQGLKLARELLTLTQLLSQHRTYAIGLLSRSNQATEGKSIKDSIDRHIAAFDVLSESIDDPELLKLWEIIKQEWPKTAKKAADHAVTPPEIFRLDAWLIAKVRDVLNVSLDHYGLSLDPYRESYFLIRFILVDAPIITEYLDQASGWGTGLLLQAEELAAKQKNATTLQNAATFQDRSRLIFMVSIVNEHLDNAELNFNHFLKVERKQAAPESSDVINKQFNKASALIKKAIGLADSEIIGKPTLDHAPMDYYQRHSQAINEMYKVIDLGGTELDAIFTRQINSASITLLTLSIIIIGLIVVCAFVALYIVNSITKPVSILVEVMQKLAAGDNTVRANLDASDEIGLLGRQFDLMVDQREAVRAKIEHENDVLNNSIVELLLSVAKLAQKDLTVRATVAEDVTGPVADALNLLSDETAKVLNRVMQIADEVAQVSRQVQSQSAVVINVAAEEKREVEQAASELNAASQAMLDIAKFAASCNEAAAKAINNTDKAQETVLDTIQGITTIRDTIRETEKRIKRLGERSQEIGGIVNLINDIAERTHILALNASMHAASAGEAGRGFAVVAGEVQKLAENAPRGDIENFRASQQYPGRNPEHRNHDE